MHEWMNTQGFFFNNRQPCTSWIPNLQPLFNSLYKSAELPTPLWDFVSSFDVSAVERGGLSLRSTPHFGVPPNYPSCTRFYPHWWETAESHLKMIFSWLSPKGTFQVKHSLMKQKCTNPIDFAIGCNLICPCTNSQIIDCFLCSEVGRSGLSPRNAGACLCFLNNSCVTRHYLRIQLLQEHFTCDLKRTPIWGVKFSPLTTFSSLIIVMVIIINTGSLLVRTQVLNVSFLTAALHEKEHFYTWACWSPFLLIASDVDFVWPKCLQRY